MEVYVARQPILDRKMNVCGYELLYRRSMNNFYEGLDDNQATAELINNAFFAMQFKELTGDTRAFINFSQDMLLKEIPLLLPKDAIVVEILERVEVTPKVIEACKKLRERGYIIALDDFAFTEEYLPLIEIAHIIKVVFPDVSIENQSKLIAEYGHKVIFLAEKVETREEYQQALSMGYDYFQGYFFSKPVIVKGKEIDTINTNLIKITNELNQKDPEYKRIAEIFEQDVGLSYKLLRLANSAYFGARTKTSSIMNALVRLGIVEIKKWIYLMMLKNIQSPGNSELIKNCLIRAKFMELIALDIGFKKKRVDYFLAGMFSSIDVLLARSMGDIMKDITLSDLVRQALMGEENEIRHALDLVLTYERSEWDELDVKKVARGMNCEKLIRMYIEALKWVTSIDE